jgi:hypothetical protein
VGIGQCVLINSLEPGSSLRAQLYGFPVVFSPIAPPPSVTRAVAAGFQADSVGTRETAWLTTRPKTPLWDWLCRPKSPLTLRHAIRCYRTIHNRVAFAPDMYSAIGSRAIALSGAFCEPIVVPPRQDSLFNNLRKESLCSVALNIELPLVASQVIRHDVQPSAANTSKACSPAEARCVVSDACSYPT